MFKYILKRFFEAIPVLLIIITLTFFMLQIAPGGPFDQEKPLPADIKASLEAYYGLDKPLFTQYLQYLRNLLHGDLGPSFKYPGWSINEIIANKLPVSIELGFYALMIAIIFGISIGILAACNQNTYLDYIPMGAAMIGICLPSFVIGPLLMLIFAIELHWLPASGWYDWTNRILPAITMGLFYAAYLARLTRGSMVEVLKQDYIRTAKAKGLSNVKIAFVHALRNGLIPIISYLGPALAGLISGSFVIETIFNIPGLGQLFIQSAFNRDYTLVLGTVLCYATALVVFNLFTDLLLVFLNPRENLSSG